jgi:hypothetical protein
VIALRTAWAVCSSAPADGRRHLTAELLTTINALQFGEPNLAAGNLLGSNMFNMLMLAIWI